MVKNRIQKVKKILDELIKIGESSVDKLSSYVESEDSSMAIEKNVGESECFTCSEWVEVVEFEKNERLFSKKAGIYIFRVSDDFEVEVADFNFPSKGYAKIKTGGKKIDKFKFNKGDCFYIGKSEDCVIDRLQGHLLGELKILKNGKEEEHPTSSLRLNSECRKNCKKHLEIAVFYLDDGLLIYKQILLPWIERELSKKLRPVVGSSKSS